MTWTCSVFLPMKPPSLIRFLFLTLALTGCTSGSNLTWPASDGSSDPDGWWVGNTTTGARIVGSGSWKNRFWLDFEGATVTAETSFIVARSASQEVIPAFSPSDLGAGVAAEDRTTLLSTILQLVQDRFTGLDAEFFLTQPTDPYHRVHIGGTNFTGRANVIGVSPLDLGNLSGTDTLFVFAQEFQSSTGTTGIELIANTISHEIGHAAGARHIDNDEALLNPIARLTANSFDKEGTLSAGGGSENSKNVLSGTLGVANAASPDSLPDISTFSMVTSGDFATLSVLEPTNVLANPSLNLRAFTYQWQFQGETASGHTVRLDFTGLDRNQPVTLTIQSPDGTKSKTVQISIRSG